MRRSVVVLAALTTCVASLWLAAGHGASRGMHLHVIPEPAGRGQPIDVEIESVDPLTAIVLALGEAEPVRERFEEPCRRCKARMTLPERIEGKTISLSAEAQTVGGKTRRSSAVVRVADPPSETP